VEPEQCVVVAVMAQISGSWFKVVEWFVSELMVKLVTAGSSRLVLGRMVRKFSVVVAVVVQHLMVDDLCLEKPLASHIGLGSHLGKNRLGMDNLLAYLLLFY
jgi:hypothetical protein